MASIQSRCAPLLARLKTQHNVTVTTVLRRNFNEELLQSLYSIASFSVDEQEEHFRRHMITNHLCHVFHADDASNRVLGFQCWRRSPGSRVIWGGKLRLLPEAQGRGLHLLSNLLATEDLFVAKVGHTPEVSISGVKGSPPLFRVGLFNIIGFNALCSSLDNFESYPFKTHPDMAACVCPELEQFTIESGFDFDLDSGVVDVGQCLPESVTKSLDKDFWRRPAVKKFLQLCPRWQDRDLFVAWEWNERNFTAIEREVNRKVNR